MPSSHFNPHTLEQQYISCRAGEKRHGKEHAFEVHHGLSPKRHGHIALAGTDVTSSIRIRGHVFFGGGGFTAQEEAPFAALSVHDGLSPSLEAQALFSLRFKDALLLFPVCGNRGSSAGRHIVRR